MGKYNSFEIIGTVCTEPREIHNGLYEFFVSTKRRSGLRDILPIRAEKAPKKSQKIRIFAEVKSSFDTHLNIWLSAEKWSLTDEPDKNEGQIVGKILEVKNIHEMSNGTVANFDFVTYANDGNSYLVPIICFNKAIKALTNPKVLNSEEVMVACRLQSREYQKLEDGCLVKHTTYELCTWYFRGKDKDEEN